MDTDQVITLFVVTIIGLVALIQMRRQMSGANSLAKDLGKDLRSSGFLIIFLCLFAGSFEAFPISKFWLNTLFAGASVALLVWPVVDTHLRMRKIWFKTEDPNPSWIEARIERLELAINQKSGKMNDHFELINWLQKVERYDDGLKAVERYEGAIRAESPGLYSNRLCSLKADLLHGAGRSEEAIRSIKAEITRGNVDIQILMTMCKILIESEKITEAKKALDLFKAKIRTEGFWSRRPLLSVHGELERKLGAI